MGPLDSRSGARKVSLAAFGTVSEEVPDSVRPAPYARTRGRSIERVGAQRLRPAKKCSHPSRDRVCSRAVSPPRQPQHDSLAPSEPEWQAVPLGVGQVPGIFGEGDFEWSPDFGKMSLQ